MATVGRKELLEQGSKSTSCTMGRMQLQGEEEEEEDGRSRRRRNDTKTVLASCRGENKLWEGGKKAI